MIISSSFSSFPDFELFTFHVYLYLSSTTRSVWIRFESSPETIIISSPSTYPLRKLLMCLRVSYRVESASFPVSRTFLWRIRIQEALLHNLNNTVLTTFRPSVPSSLHVVWFRVVLMHTDEEHLLHGNACRV